MSKAPEFPSPSVELVTLSCNECGAPLEVPSQTKFLTCRFCGSRLAVAHTGGAVYTNTLEALNRKADLLADEVQLLRLEHDLERLDRDWEVESKLHMVKDNNGNEQVPTAGGAIAGTAVFIGVGLAVMVISLTQENFGGFFLLAGLAAIGLGLFSGISAHRKATLYNLAHVTYLNARFDLVRQIDELRAKRKLAPLNPQDDQ